MKKKKKKSIAMAMPVSLFGYRLFLKTEIENTVAK